MEDYSDTEPVRSFAQKRGFSPTRVYEWEDQGHIKTVLIGKRRHVIVATYDAFVRRLAKEQAGARLPSSNPRARTNQAGVGEPVSGAIGQTNAAPLTPGTEHRTSRAKATMPARASPKKGGRRATR